MLRPMSCCSCRAATPSTARSKKAPRCCDHPALAAAAEIWALDANVYFSRPGPRVVDGVELLASVLHPDAFPARAGATRLR